MYAQRIEIKAITKGDANKLNRCYGIDEKTLT
jgi:hypothetical protein